jgi:hypothetical protein
LRRAAKGGTIAKILRRYPMRGLCLALSLAVFAAPALAGDLPVTSRVSAATVYPDGATVTREAEFSAPAGQHELILTDLPRGTPLESVRVALDGARLGGVRTREDDLPPRDAQESNALRLARAEVERLEEALRAGRAQVADIRLEADAARARLRFLDGIARAGGRAAQQPAALSDLVAMIGRETLEARRAEAGAERRAEAAERALGELVEELSRARQALDALVPETQARTLLAIGLTAGAATQGRLSITYTVPQAGWQPLYDLHLDRDAGRVRIERGAYLHQATGENWRDIALTLSTRRPTGQGEPGELHPWIARLDDPGEIRPMLKGRGRADRDGRARRRPRGRHRARRLRRAFGALCLSRAGEHRHRGRPGAVDAAVCRHDGRDRSPRRAVSGSKCLRDGADTRARGRCDPAHPGGAILSRRALCRTALAALCCGRRGNDPVLRADRGDHAGTCAQNPRAG